MISCLWLSHIIILNLKSHSDRGSKRNLILTHIDFWPHNGSSWFSYNLRATLPWPTSRSLSSPAANGIPIWAERTTSDTEIHCQCREVHLVGARFQPQSNLSLPLGCLPDYNGYTPILPSCKTTAVVCSKESSVGEIWRHKHLYLDVALLLPSKAVKWVSQDPWKDGSNDLYRTNGATGSVSILWLYHKYQPQGDFHSCPYQVGHICPFCCEEISCISFSPGSTPVCRSGERIMTLVLPQHSSLEKVSIVH